MIIEQAYYNFWSSFGVPAYEENSVPSDAKTPYITYQIAIGDYDSYVPLSASVWHRDTSFVRISAIIKEIQKKLANGGFKQPCEDGYLWIVANKPLGDYMNEPDDDIMKRFNLMINVRYYIGG